MMISGHPAKELQDSCGMCMVKRLELPPITGSNAFPERLLISHSIPLTDIRF